MSKKEIKFNEEYEIEVKRFYIPEEIVIDCPHCQEKMSFFGNSEYLSYPTLNAEEMAYAYCDNCDTEVEMPVKLKMSMEYDIDKVKEI